MIRPLLSAIVAIGLAAGLACCPLLTAAQSPEPLCVDFAAVSTTTPEPSEPLAGRLGGSRESFEARFGPPTEETELTITYGLEGCGDLFVDYQEGILTDIDFIAPGYMSGDAEWSFSQAMQIAARLLPPDVQQREPFRNVSFVEHQPCYSDALAAQVPMSVYGYLDANPTPGQCSVSYEFNDASEVVLFTVQLQIEDPN